MAKAKAKHRQRVSLQKRRRDLIKTTQNRKQKQESTSRKRKAEEARKREADSRKAAARLFDPTLRTLLVGEGNFSFTRALVRRWEAERRASAPPGAKNPQSIEDLVGYNVVATCLDTKEELVEKYPDVKDIVREIKAYGVTVLCGIDATCLLDSKRIVKALGELCEGDLAEAEAEAEAAALEGQDEEEDEDGGAQAKLAAKFGFDRIIFNFPHLGCGVKDTEENSSMHRDMLEKFFHSAHSVLAKDGQILVTVKCGEPYESWRVPRLATGTGLLGVHSSAPFDPRMFEGYEHRRTVGAPQREGVLEPNVDVFSDKTQSRTLIFVHAGQSQKNSKHGKKQAAAGARARSDSKDSLGSLYADDE